MLYYEPWGIFITLIGIFLFFLLCGAGLRKVWSTSTNLRRPQGQILALSNPYPATYNSQICTQTRQNISYINTVPHHVFPKNVMEEPPPSYEDAVNASRAPIAQPLAPMNLPTSS